MNERRHTVLKALYRSARKIVFIEDLVLEARLKEEDLTSNSILNRVAVEECLQYENIHIRLWKNGIYYITHYDTSLTPERYLEDIIKYELESEEED